MIKQRDRKQQKENDVAVAGGFIKAAGAGGTAGFTPPAAISGVSLQPGFTIESEILSARVKEQEYAEYSKSLAEAAVQKERKGDFSSSPTFWQEAQRMDSISRDYGAKASFYEQLRYTPASAAAVMSTGGAPRPTVPGGKPATPIVQTTRSAQPRSFSGYDNTWVMPQTAPPAGDDQGVEDRVALDFDSASSTAKKAYEAYRAAQKEFDNEYGWRRNPTSHGGYGAAYGELQELKQAYLESLDFLLDNYDSFQTNIGIPPVVNGTVAERETLQIQLNQLVEQMWDYYHTDPENTNPEAIAWYIEDIAAIKNAIAALPEESAKIAPELKERLIQMGDSATSEVAGGFVQSVATTTEWLSQYSSTEGSLEDLKVTLDQLVQEYNTYLAAGISEDNTLVVQLKEAIDNTKAQIEYVQSGSRGEEAANARQELYSMASDYYDAADTARDKATEGLGTLSQIMVDVGIEGLKLLFDYGVGKIIGGKGTGSNLLRSFSDGAHESAEAGWGVQKQIGDGLKSAAQEYLMGMFVEKGGVLDKLDDGLIKQIANSIGGNEKLIEHFAKVPVNMMGVYLTTFMFACAETIYNNALTGEHNRNDTKEVTTDAISNFMSSSISYIPQLE